MDDCTDTKLEKFSLEHYTFINQFFGDETVREIIAEFFPSERYQFKIESVGEEFENSHHHILIDNITKKKDNIVCSVKSGYQNIGIDKNDTLCQSYSLLTYFEKPINTDKVKRQIDMVDMYEELLNNRYFIKKLNESIDIPNSNWFDYRKEGHPPIAILKQTFFRNVRIVLKNWREYGYWYFIGDGKCPIKSKSKSKSQ